jgi:hypothetical protein
MISELVNKLLLTAASGVALGIACTVSPLSVVSVILAVPLIVMAGRGLPADEQRWLRGILLVALSVRVIIIGALFARAIPQLNDLAIGSLSGDDAYYLGRAIRARDLLFGFATTKYDYFVVLDEYGRTRYLDLLTLLQVVFGPTPFGMRVLNALFYVAGAILLFRVARPAFGRTAAFAGLIALLFMPSQIWASISLLKESLYFCVAALLVYSVVRAVRARTAIAMAGLGVMAAVSLWLLNDLRRDALLLAGAGLALAALLYFLAGSTRRLVAATAAAVLAIAIALPQPPVQARLIDTVETVAQVHGGHVFTVGHSYKLLEPGFYKYPAAPGSWELFLTFPQAARYLVRAAVTFVVTPLPWEMASRSELLLLPEQLLWYGMLIALPFGIREGWRRDAVTTAVLVGFVLPFAAAIALTNGNVGTLLRLRGLVSPYLIWVSALGALALLDLVLRQRAVPPPRLATGGATA